MTGAYLRRISGRNERPDEKAGSIHLVGVVHDHPASIYRVQSVVEAVDPDVVALEVPPLAVPLFRRYADDERTPPTFGGEMSAAVQSARTDRVAGIDGPSRQFLARLAGNCLGTTLSRSGVRSVLGNLASTTKRALTCRLTATVVARTGLLVAVDRPVAHDASLADDPAAQAAEERRQARRATTVFQSLELPPSRHVQQTSREEHMAERLGTLRQEGDVVAVVGVGHLQPLVETLRAS